ncbi:MerR family transcriptional regulator [Lactobacillus sp. DCY120]|uniref:MerR family transcriptional regulator n=1 Tax=Bombilactobacillus apium TaxID=2675299 RepID=A0A850R201_9LACO|nr:MerR family transcriptional regulator [Bombilactobacillus apium]NVY96380.1 MerR family transcriptional regulator [Bombilactobacillus apium]
MRIEAVAQQFTLTKDTLRYWERIGLLPAIQRDEHGYRNYTPHDLNWVFYIQSLRKAGMTIEKLIEFVQLYRQGSTTVQVRKQLLEDQRTELIQQVATLQKTINYLTYKVDHFADHTLTYEQEKLAYDHFDSRGDS